MPHRTYDENEVAALLRRATELQVQASQSGAPGDAQGSARPGLSLDEIAAAATAAGLDPEYVRQAAAEASAFRVRATAQATHREITTDRWVEGALSDAAKEDIVMELRHRFEDGGAGAAWGMGAPYGTPTVQALGQSVEWSYVQPSTGTQTRVLLQPREGGVRIRVARSNAYSTTSTAWSVWYAPFLAFAAALPAGIASGSLAIAVLVAIATTAAAVPLLSRLHRSALAKHREEVERLADEIVTYVRAPWAPPVSAPPVSAPPVAASSPAAPQLDLPDDDAWGEEARGAEARDGSRVRGRYK